jgi:hypothetical protein
MKYKSYKNLVTLFALCILGTVTAQKFDKKFTENFKTNKDVEVAINATNTEINVTTWNKNEVQVEAFIEIEGLTKKEAEEYFKNWEFEALGNKRKVKIKSKDSFKDGFNTDFTYFDNMNFDFDFSDIDFSNLEVIELPNLNLDFDLESLLQLENVLDIDKLVEQDSNYEFYWKDDDHNIKINSKEEWEAFKKTKEYSELKKKMSIDKERMKVEFSKSKKRMKKQLIESKRSAIKNKIKMKLELAKAKENLKKIKSNFYSDSNEFKVNGKKVKIKKRLEIKVPKGATFDLNTRHCKIKLPNTVASGNVDYGSFDASNLSGGKLTIGYSPVRIKDLNACTLFLNNVTDAKIASVTNTSLFNNSSGVVINQVNEKVIITDKFGELKIENFNPNFGELFLNLSQSNAYILLGDVNSKFKYNVNKVKLANKRAGKGVKNTGNNLITVNGDYSEITIE